MSKARSASGSETLLGYTDQRSYVAGDTVDVHLSAEPGEATVDLVRLTEAASDRPDEGIAPPLVHPGAKAVCRVAPHAIPRGSYVSVADHEALRLGADFTLQLWAQPTLPRRGRQGLLVKREAAGGGYGLVLDQGGRVVLEWAGASLASNRPLRAHGWYFLAASFRAADAAVTLVVQPLSSWLRDEQEQLHAAVAHGPAPADAPLLMGAAAIDVDPASGAALPSGCFNGKLSAPRLWRRALAIEDLATLRRGAAPHVVHGDMLIAAWDFAAGSSSTTVPDAGPYGCIGRTGGAPERAVTGPLWDGSVVDPAVAPAQYAAIRFHEDAVEDACWPVAARLSLPAGSRSGVYAVRVRTGREQDELPIFVVPEESARRDPVTRVAVWLPTFTYQAYANRRFGDDVMAEYAAHRRFVAEPKLSARERLVVEHPELGISLYDRHVDGRRCTISSRRRPMVDMRRDFVHWVTGAPRHFASDMAIVGWLERRREPYAILTDEIVHARGRAALTPFDVVVLGTHPEYTSDGMWRALESYIAHGGRAIALSGNMLFWVTSVAEDRPHLIEVRRGHLADPEGGPMPGELHQSFTGEPSGLWRARGRAARRVLGIASSGLGYPRAVPYARLPAADDPRARFVFEGVESALIGEGVGAMGGAVGDEFDSADFDLGTPPTALVLASSKGLHPPDHTGLHETPSALSIDADGGTETGHADMVFLSMPGGGAVFSVGSMAWAHSLVEAEEGSDLSRITGNVLREFLREDREKA